MSADKSTQPKDDQGEQGAMAQRDDAPLVGLSTDTSQHGSGAYPPAEQTGRMRLLKVGATELENMHQLLVDSLPDMAEDRASNINKVSERTKDALKLLTDIAEWLQEQTIKIEDKVKRLENIEQEMKNERANISREFIGAINQGRNSGEFNQREQRRIDVSNHKGIASMKNFNNDRDAIRN